MDTPEKVGVEKGKVVRAIRPVYGILESPMN